jgi:hypothetical protein
MMPVYASGAAAVVMETEQDVLHDKGALSSISVCTRRLRNPTSEREKKISEIVRGAVDDRMSDVVVARSQKDAVEGDCDMWHVPFAEDLHLTAPF